MAWSLKYEMKWYLWLGWFYHTLIESSAYPVTSSIDSAAPEDHQLWIYQLRYVVGSSMTIILMILSIFACLCCRRQRQVSKGFQEFKDGSAAASETVIESGLSCLELEIPRSSSNNRVEFEALPVERLVSESRLAAKPKPPSPSLFDHEFDDRHPHNREWFSTELHISRERLKYLREIGRGWFGKVVEGSQNFDDVSTKTQGIVVKILTEEATASEKAWFLGEALPYLKLHHKNMLKLFGACLETDPYLLVFESCPNGDLKSFLQANYGSEVLIKENLLLKMSLDVASALGHMHSNGFAHTDLSARNCLVTSNLSAKLGDYGTGVEKYPDDYYVVGDRALPIRWSAPESLVCTDTTIETRAITPNANLWSLAILLYEIASWGGKPYPLLSDEQVIEMILSLNFESHLKLESLTHSPSDNIIEAIKSCWKINMNDRAELNKIMMILQGNELENFEERWENLKPNVRGIINMSDTSTEELHQNHINLDGSWDHVGQVESKEANPSTLQAHFRLGPEEPIHNQNLQESGSETEEESWRGRVERGAYTEKVKQKSKSIADLMVLVHIDSDSEAEWSLGPQASISDKPPRKKIPSSGSVGDLPSMVIDEFDVALRKLRDPINNTNSHNHYTNNSNNSERLKISTKDSSHESYYNPPEYTSTPKQQLNANEKSKSSSSNENLYNVESWKNALEFELERKAQGFEVIDFEEIIESSNSIPDLLTISASLQDTTRSRVEKENKTFIDNENFYSNNEKESMNNHHHHQQQQQQQQQPVPDEEDERKLLTTPDDERSSDSGFRDKESCEEEDNNTANCSIPHSSTEEEQLKILYELDTILDAECSVSSFEDDNRPSNCLKVSTEDISTESLSQPTQFISTDKPEDSNTSETTTSPNKDTAVGRDDFEEISVGNALKMANTANGDNDDDDDDDSSSTMSLKSDNSYVSFNLDEEFVAAIRNELREKLPMAQMAVVESQELHDEDDRSSASNVQEFETNSWNSNEDEPEHSERTSGTIDIAIRYNIYGTPLSPILEERESAATSELISREDSKEDDASVASKLSAFSEDVILVDTTTNKVLLVEGSNDLHQNTDQDVGGESCEELSEDEGSIGYPLKHFFANKSQFNEMSRTGKRPNCAPLPSPEEESRWQSQFPIPLQLQDDLMSTSFSTEHDWDSQDEDEEEGGERCEPGKDDELGEDQPEVDDEDNSSSSGEFVWKRYNEESNRDDLERGQTYLNDKIDEEGDEEDEGEEEEEEDEDEDEDEDEEEFTPSAWDATLEPHRSALRSPEKTNRTGDQKKNVWFKKQRYHCVYEYPKETSATESAQSPASTTTWEPTSYTDWEEMIDEPQPRDIYPLDYDESNQPGDEEFFVSSGNRPFHFRAGGGKYVSQFFPGANVELLPPPNNGNCQNDNQQIQLGELRHTRDKLKLNLPLNQTSDTATMSQRVNEQLNLERPESPIHQLHQLDDSSFALSVSQDDQLVESIIESPQETPDDGSASVNDEEECGSIKTDDHYPRSSGRPLIISSLKKNEESESSESQDKPKIPNDSETTDEIKQVDPTLDSEKVTA